MKNKSKCLEEISGKIEGLITGDNIFEEDNANLNHIQINYDLLYTQFYEILYWHHWNQILNPI